jgi:hypothetical protein
MSDDILDAMDEHGDHLQSPVDDLFSLFYTMQWAAVFNNREFAAQDVPIKLKAFRENLLGTRYHRSHATVTTILEPFLTPQEYGSVLAQCHPLLRAWYWELRGLNGDWKKWRSKLRRQKTKAETYIPIFSILAVRGVARLAELVHEYTKDMED